MSRTSGTPATRPRWRRSAGPSTVRSPGVTVPEPLRRAAVDAWEHDDEDLLPAVETDVQRRLRDDAGTLALVGLSVLRAEDSSREVLLAPDLVTGAVTAAHRQRG